MKKVLFALALVGALSAMATPASAALIEKNVKVTANFLDSSKATLFYDFDIRFDNASDIKATFDGLTVYASPFGFNLMYSYTVASDRFDVGNYAKDGSISFSAPVDTVSISLRHISQERVISASSAKYTLGNQFYATNRVTISSSSISSAVPEPATWALMILGFGAVGYAMRRRPKAVVRFT